MILFWWVGLFWCWGIVSLGICRLQTLDFDAVWFLCKVKHLTVDFAQRKTWHEARLRLMFACSCQQECICQLSSICMMSCIIISRWVGRSQHICVLLLLVSTARWRFGPFHHWLTILYCSVPALKNGAASRMQWRLTSFLPSWCNTHTLVNIYHQRTFDTLQMIPEKYIPKLLAQQARQQNVASS